MSKNVGYFRKKPVVIEAVRRHRGENDAEVRAFVGAAYTASPDRIGEVGIETLEGTMWADDGDWIIKGVAGEFYPCKPDIFAYTYEVADVLR